MSPSRSTRSATAASEVRTWASRTVRRVTGRRTIGEEHQQLRAAGLLTVGRFSYTPPRIRVWGDPEQLAAAGTRVSIGAFCSIGPEVELLVNGGHRTDWVTTFPLRLRLGLEGAGQDGTPTGRGGITIGNDVWIGMRTLVMDGADVGDGAVVAAGSVVTGRVRPYAVVAGAPAREVRRRFTDDQVERLLALRWWDWPLERIRAEVDQLCSPDVEALLARVDGG